MKRLELTAGPGSKAEGNYELLPPGKIINSDLYRQQVMRLKQEVEKNRPALIYRKGVGFQNDNAKYLANIESLVALAVTTFYGHPQSQRSQQFIVGLLCRNMISDAGKLMEREWNDRRGSGPPKLIFTRRIANARAAT
ncbi:hypothetical protein EVAR_85728_1 [Eumeta japonica]|uniref:Uncharacterized protein n=1 Tax=Eumeta variegata TaxID=151549 RepID=A0A4C1Y345_EUMVA|nr:hypothetical protein EVAR_85728_1 [Eumeta japonica]